MNTIDKIKESWWVILSFILFLNGVGFIYLGFKRNNRNWVLEGIMYEIPWFVYFIYFSVYGAPKGFVSNPTSAIMLFALLLMLVSIVRSIWVAVKLLDVYDLEEKPPKITTVSNNSNDDNGKLTCCICIIFLFIIFAFMAIL